MDRAATDRVAPPPRPHRTRLVLLTIFIALVATFYLSGLYKTLTWDELKSHRDMWRAFVDQNQTFSAVVFVILSVALMSLSLPVGSILSLIAGALFDMWMGVGLIIVASAFGMTCAFL